MLGPHHLLLCQYVQLLPLIRMLALSLAAFGFGSPNLHHDPFQAMAAFRPDLCLIRVLSFA